ncbi:hypothetical protein [Pelagibaculum spongiae]|uniref:Uncharacterized protein n=1 Tax=Pelagibaculum spongiae TaxID=2080658 RepID=A0A2V1H306_9GAMM|nr:hypothetical protein [Pelagibaculum spongiae]PVZ72360.1 hypothetical protein DC094_04960 [Pelagibaculum spongiae]
MHQKLFRFTAENNDHCKIIFLTMGDYSREQVNESAQLLMNHHRSRAPHLVTDLSGGTGFDVINRTILYSMEQSDSSIRQATFKNYGPHLGKRPVDDRNGILKRIGVERYLAAYAVGSDKNEVIVIDDSKRVREQVNLINRKCVSKLDIYDPQAEDYQMQLAYIGCRILYYQRAALKAEHEATTGSGSPKLMKPGGM